MFIRSYSSIVIKHILYLSKKGFSTELMRETITVYSPSYKVPSLKGIKYIIQYYILNVFVKLKAPPKSPDLNQIEWLYYDFKVFIRDSDLEPTTETELAMLIKIYKSTLTKEKCQRYINRLNRVIDDVIKRRGGWSDY